jgi:hydrogenase/urease accessory protein HupE
MQWKGKALTFIVAVLAAVPAFAHPVPFSYLDVQVQRSVLDVTLTVHIYDVAHDLQIAPMERLLEGAFLAQQDAAVKALLASRLQLSADGRVLTPEWLNSEILHDRQSVRYRLRYEVASPPGVVSVQTVMFPYDSNHQTFINIYEGEALSQYVLNANHSTTEYISGTRQGVFAVVRRFIPAGVHHILIGPDHLLFLVGLLLLGGSLKKLAMVVTAFTAAHSITLSLSALNLVTPPASLIEPAIALSIVYVGADNLLAQGGRDVRAWIAFAFGFIHGFGFANVLREMELPGRALGWSLFSFNLGVEIGQLFVVVAVASVFAALRSRSEWAGRLLLFAGSIIVMIAGAFWFVQRVFFPGGI